MKALPKLHDIIKSLSTAEVKYVRNYIIFSSKGVNNNVLRLYDELKKLANYDEPAFKKKHSGKPFIKNLAVNKVNLEEKVLFALFLYNKEDTPNTRVKILIEQGKAAAGKSALESALKIFNKAASICRQNELFELLLEVNNCINSLSLVSPKDALKLIAENTDICLRLINIYEYQSRNLDYSIYANVYGHVNLHETKQKINQLASSPPYTSPDKALSIRAKGFYYFVIKENARLNADTFLVYKHSMEVLTLFESNPVYLSSRAGLYQKLIFDCIRFNIWLLVSKQAKNKKKLRQELEILMHKMEVTVKIKFNKLEEKQTAELVYQQAQLYYKELLLGDEMPDNYYKHLSKKLTLENYSLLGVRLGHILYAIGAQLLIRNRLALALLFNNKILDEKKETFTKDTVYFAHFLRLMIHFDLGNYTLIENFVRSTERFLKLNNYYKRGERELLKLFRTLCTSPVTERRKIFSDFKTTLSQLTTNTDFQFDHDYYRLEMWLDNKLKTKNADA